MVYAIKLEFDLGFVHSARLYRGWKGRAVAYKRYSEAMQENGQFGAPFLIFFSLSLSLFFSLSLSISLYVLAIKQHLSLDRLLTWFCSAKSIVSQRFGNGY